MNAATELVLSEDTDRIVLLRELKFSKPLGQVLLASRRELRCGGAPFRVFRDMTLKRLYISFERADFETACSGRSFTKLARVRLSLRLPTAQVSGEVEYC